MTDQSINLGPAVPRYGDLPTIGATGEHHCWHVFGDDDQLGTLNFLSEAAVVSAAQEIKAGQVVCLSLPLDLPNPALGTRRPFEHVVSRSPGGRDDSLNGFFLQCSSQWDGLQHVRYREFGYYGGRQETALDSGALGIDVVAVRGIVGRGVLVDVERYLRENGRPIDPQQRVTISAEMLDDTLAWQGTRLVRGDVLVLRTGWLTWYLSLNRSARDALGGKLHNGADGMDAPGLDPGRATAAWLWDHGISAIAADNPALEALRVRREDGFLHRRILALLGMPIGEFWALDKLSDLCAQLGRWTFFLTSAPLRLPGGVGSPSNAYAVL